MPEVIDPVICFSHIRSSPLASQVGDDWKLRRIEIKRVEAGSELIKNRLDFVRVSSDADVKFTIVKLQSEQARFSTIDVGLAAGDDTQIRAVYCSDRERRAELGFELRFGESNAEHRTRTKLFKEFGASDYESQSVLKREDTSKTSSDILTQ